MVSPARSLIVRATTTVCINALMHTMSKQVTRPQRRRREHSPEFKRELVERSLLPNASVASIALQAGINANLLFMWRRAHLDAMQASTPPAVLVPVELADVAGQAGASATPPLPPRTPGTIEIELAGARVRLRGAVDEAGLRCVLQALHALA